MAAIAIQDLSHQTSRCMVMVKAGEAVDTTEQGTIIDRMATGRHAALLACVRRQVATEPVDEVEVDLITATLLEMRKDERY